MSEVFFDFFQDLMIGIGAMFIVAPFLFLPFKIFFWAVVRLFRKQYLKRYDFN